MSDSSYAPEGVVKSHLSIRLATALVALVLVLPAPAVTQQIPTPEEFFGFQRAP